MSTSPTDKLGQLEDFEIMTTVIPFTSRMHTVARLFRLAHLTLPVRLAISHVYTLHTAYVMDYAIHIDPKGATSTAVGPKLMQSGRRRPRRTYVMPVQCGSNVREFGASAVVCILVASGLCGVTVARLSRCDSEYSILLLITHFESTRSWYVPVSLTHLRHIRAATMHN